MLRTEIREKLYEVFGATTLDLHKDEWELRTFDQNTIVKKVGWATTLLPEIVDKAIESNLDFIVTHHDPWNFLYELRTQSLAKLENANIGHLFVHGPLDQIEFGTAGSVLERIGCKISMPAFEHDGICWGRIGELMVPVSIEQIENILSSQFLETPKFKCNSVNECSKIAVLTGAGNNSLYIKEAIGKGCDTFITGEYSCYFAMYIKSNCLNSLVYSHTYTEKHATKNLANKLFGSVSEIEIVEIDEPHY